ncbi:hypothetical protein F5Y16DRAFT_407867 [Xylariaceae sp. FL0255]|nr:hypothetical protein F5Y16DRAFT_407867 [Xylariaceae sp. FL0255]
MRSIDNRHVADPDTHTMGRSLLSYVKQKIQQYLQDNSFECIQIIGVNQRPTVSSGATIDSVRPAMRRVNPRTIQLLCFPSRNLVLHYVNLFAAFRQLWAQHHFEIEYDLPEITSGRSIIRNSNLKLIGLKDLDLAVVGNVDNFGGVIGPGDSWQGIGESEHDIFRWKISTSATGRTTALIGCVERIWGHTGEHLLRELHAQLKVKTVIYIAKCGSLRKGFNSNECIATGQQSFIEDGLIERSTEWPSPFGNALKTCTKIAHGPVVTVATPLCESDQWLSKWEHNAAWVDCEVGFMAKAADELKIAFGFLLIVSDNLHHTTEENLSNENSKDIAAKRNVLYKEIVGILSRLIHT